MKELTPEQIAEKKEKKRLYDIEYRSRPEVKERYKINKKKYQIEYYKRPEVKKMRKDYYSRPDIIEREKLYGKEYLGVERSTFIINKTGKIERIWRKVKVQGHVEEILGVLANL